MEMFLFKSDGGATAITGDGTGSNLPDRSGGWKPAGSIGDFSDALGEESLARLRKDGYVVFENVTTDSTRSEDWQRFPPGSFHLTDRALKRVKKMHEDSSRYSIGPSIIGFNWGVVRIKDEGSPQWRNLGMKLTVGIYTEGQVPAAAIEHFDGVPIVFTFHPPWLPKPRPTTIDVDPDGFNGFVFAD